MQSFHSLTLSFPPARLVSPLPQVHVLLLGAPWWPKAKDDWPLMIPTITLMSTIPPIILLFVKALLVVPPVSMIMSRIRSGGCSEPQTHPSTECTLQMSNVGYR